LHGNCRRESPRNNACNGGALDNHREKTPYWFEHHPVLILSGLKLGPLSSSLIGAEKILSITAITKRPVIERFIQLREHAPFQNTYMYPTDYYMMNTDSLVQNKYRFRNGSQRFIMPSHVHDKPNVLIVFLGGSTTECGLWMSWIGSPICQVIFLK